MNILLGIFLGLVLVTAVYWGAKEIRSRAKGRRTDFFIFLTTILALVIIILLDILEVISSQLFLGAIVIVLWVAIGYIFVKEGIKETFKDFVKGRKYFFQSVVLLLSMAGAFLGIEMLSRKALIPSWTKNLIWGLVFYIAMIEFLKILLIDQDKASKLKEWKGKYGKTKGEILFVLFWMLALPIAIGYFLSIPFVAAVKKAKEKM